MTEALGTAFDTRSAKEREIVITRRFDAPAALLFKMWTEAEHVTRWWAPAGYTTTVREMDARPGGTFRLVMHGPDGTDYPVKGVYKEVSPPRRLVYSDDWDDDSKPSMEALVTVTFDEKDGKTTLTLHILCATPEDRTAMIDMGVVTGWTSCFDKLAEELAKT